MKNFVTVDWRNGPDRIFFFFKDTNTYSSFHLGNNHVEEGYPTSVAGHWEDFGQHVKDLRFGFTTPSPDWHSAGGGDMVWFFYLDGDNPMVCKYSQINSKVVFKKSLSDTDWWPLGNFFNKIVGVMLDEKADSKHTYWVFLNDGRYFQYSPRTPRPPKVKPFKGSEWKELENYKDRIITTALNDFSIFNTYFYFFLTNNEYLRFDVKKRTVTGPFPVHEGTWPGLITK